MTRRWAPSVLQAYLVVEETFALPLCVAQIKFDQRHESSAETDACGRTPSATD